MFFQPRPRSHACGYGHPWYQDYGTGTSQRLGELETQETALAEARRRLVAWGRQLEDHEARLQSRTRHVERREKEVEDLQGRLKQQADALKMRVAILDAADAAGAARSEAVLHDAAAQVIQRAMRRHVASRKAQAAVNGMRTLKELDRQFLTAREDFASCGCLPLLEDRLTKLLEKADGIMTSEAPRMLRSRRKEFVRRVMAVLDHPNISDDDADDDMSFTSSGSDAD